MKIQFDSIDNILVVKFFGEIDHHYTEQTREEIDRKFFNTKATNIIFDFTKVDFMDSSGIGMIIGRYKLAKERGGKASAFGFKDNVKRIFEMAGLTKLINIFENENQALNSALGR